MKENTSGWDAIEKRCHEIYPDQLKPKHYETIISWALGGNDPLEGISIYDGGDYWHFVTYGLSELYEKVSKNKELSGYGMEFTLKLKKDNYEDETEELENICVLLQTLARATFKQGEIFLPYEYMYTGKTDGIDCSKKSLINSLITIPDKQFGQIDTPNGKVEFIEFIGITNDELEQIQTKKLTVKELYEKLGSDITDYNRKSII